MTLDEFVVHAEPPPPARLAAARAVLDTIGVTLAGACEPAADIVRRVVGNNAAGPCTVLGTGVRGAAPDAALANGTAAHALDFDDMCFVSLAHPSAPLVSAALAAAEVAGGSGRALLDAYCVGFEIEARLGRAMNPRHYRRGWHCTSTLGTIGAAAAAARLLALDDRAAQAALSIAASEASGLKENFGTMVKPLHAGLAARNGVLAALLARSGMNASAGAIDGAQGFLTAMDSEHDRDAFRALASDLGTRWEILETGITVKLYPSCAATHPTLDAILDLKRQERLDAAEIERIEIGVDPITPTVLLYEKPQNGLQAKFSMPFCAAAAAVKGRVGIATFDAACLADPSVEAMRTRVTMYVDLALDASARPLTQARVRIVLRDGRILSVLANGARGYPERPASDRDLADKFLSCAARAMPPADAERALTFARRLDEVPDIRIATAALARDRVSTP